MDLGLARPNGRGGGVREVAWRLATAPLHAGHQLDRAPRDPGDLLGTNSESPGASRVSNLRLWGRNFLPRLLRGPAVFVTGSWPGPAPSAPPPVPTSALQAQSAAGTRAPATTTHPKGPRHLLGSPERPKGLERTGRVPRRVVRVVPPPPCDVSLRRPPPCWPARLLVPEAGVSAGLRRAGMGMRVASRRLEALLAGMVRGPVRSWNPVDVFSRECEKDEYSRLTSGQFVRERLSVRRPVSCAFAQSEATSLPPSIQPPRPGQRAKTRGPCGLEKGGSCCAPRSSDHEFQAAQGPTLGQPRKPTWERGLGELSTRPVQGGVPSSSTGPADLQSHRRPSGDPDGAVLVQGGGGDEKKGEEKLHWVEMWGGDGVGQLLKSPAFRPALARCIGLRRYHPPPTGK